MSIHRGELAGLEATGCAALVRSCEPTPLDLGDAIDAVFGQPCAPGRVGSPPGDA